MKTIITVFVLLILALLIVNSGAFGGNNLGEEGKMKELNDKYKDAIFAGGCFWCIEAGFQEKEGVVEAISGYTGGETEDPTYAQVISGQTGHYEAVRVIYDPEIISYSELVEVFWRYIDPTDDSGQFVDKGSQYRTAIFYESEEQKEIAEKSKANLEESGRFSQPIVTEILPRAEFYEAEEYHQDYSDKKTLAYELYKKGSGRGKLKDIWKE